MQKLFPYAHLIVPTAFALAHGRVNDVSNTSSPVVADVDHCKNLLVGVIVVLTTLVRLIIWSKIRSSG